MELDTSWCSWGGGGKISGLYGSAPGNEPVDDSMWMDSQQGIRFLISAIPTILFPRHTLSYEEAYLFPLISISLCSELGEAGNTSCTACRLRQRLKMFKCLRCVTTIHARFHKYVARLMEQSSTNGIGILPWVTRYVYPILSPGVADFLGLQKCAR